MKTVYGRLLFFVLFLLGGASVAHGIVKNSKHDLSTPETPEPCVFCHTPHHSNYAIQVPLWNRGHGTTPYTMYTSPTMDSDQPAAPRAYSIACLGCHNGVAAPINAYNDDKHGLFHAPGPGGGPPDMTSYPNCEKCHVGFYGAGEPGKTYSKAGISDYFRVGPNLMGEHPISISYPPDPSKDPFFVVPPNTQAGWSGNDIKLYYGYIECPSCHSVHDPSIPPFLRKSNAGSALCYTCHIK